MICLWLKLFFSDGIEKMCIKILKGERHRYTLEGIDGAHPEWVAVLSDIVYQVGVPIDGIQIYRHPVQSDIAKPQGVRPGRTIDDSDSDRMKAMRGKEALHLSWDVKYRVSVGPGYFSVTVHQAVDQKTRVISVHGDRRDIPA